MPKRYKIEPEYTSLERKHKTGRYYITGMETHALAILGEEEAKLIAFALNHPGLVRAAPAMERALNAFIECDPWHNLIGGYQHVIELAEEAILQVKKKATPYARQERAFSE